MVERNVEHIDQDFRFPFNEVMIAQRNKKGKE